MISGRCVVQRCGPSLVGRRWFSSDAMALLASQEYSQAALAASSSFGLFGLGNDVTDRQWKSFTEKFSSELDPDATPIEAINDTLESLARSNVTLGGFWSGVFESKLDGKIKAEKMKISDLIRLIASCNIVDFRSDAAIEKLITYMLENQTAWTVSPEDLVEVAKVVSESFTQNRQLFTEIGNRVTLEHSGFALLQLVCLVESFARINVVNSELARITMKRILAEWDDADVSVKIRLATATSRLRFRSDTFFKRIMQDMLQGESLASVDDITSVCVAMQSLKMNQGSTDWWNREDDFSQLLKRVKSRIGEDLIERMSGKALANLVQTIRNEDLGQRNCNAILERMKHLLLQEPLSKSYRQLAVVLEALSRGSKSHGFVSTANTRWIAEWLCGNVFILPVHDICSINRSIAKLGFRDHNYHKVWIPYYLERLDELAKEDVASITDNFNSIGMTDTQMGGRHFFYKLGKRFQELSVSSNGEKEQSERRKFKTMQRLG